MLRQRMDFNVIGQRIYTFVDSQCLPVGLVFGILVGIIVPPIGVLASKGSILSRICVIIIFCEYTFTQRFGISHNLCDVLGSEPHFLDVQ